MIEKTLDDVIKALAFCQKGLCDEECPYWYEEENRILCQEIKCIHAQYYLEEYKKLLENMDKVETKQSSSLKINLP